MKKCVCIITFLFCCFNFFAVCKPSVSPNDGNKKIKYANTTEISCGFGFGSIKFQSLNPSVNGSEITNNDFSIGANIVNGVRFKEFLQIGIGAGVDKYNSSAILIPVTFDLRLSFLRGRIRPTLNFSYGKAYAFGGLVGGLASNNSVGAKIFLSEKAALIFNIGYKIQESNMLYTFSTQTYTHQFLSLTTGISF